MTAKRWTGSANQDLATKKRWTGSAFVDISTAKRWDGTAWQNIAFAGGSGFSISLSPTTAYGTRAGLIPVARITTNDVTATTTGGTSPYTYAWSYVSGSTAISANSPTSATTSFSANVTNGDTYTATFKVVATDSSAATIEAYVPVTLYYEPA